MTYYKATQGSWRDGDHVRVIRESYSRKEIFKAAQNRANQTGRAVRVTAHNGTNFSSFEVLPERI